MTVLGITGPSKPAPVEWGEIGSAVFGGLADAVIKLAVFVRLSFADDRYEPHTDADNVPAVDGAGLAEQVTDVRLLAVAALVVAGIAVGLAIRRRRW